MPFNKLTIVITIEYAVTGHEGAVTAILGLQSAPKNKPNSLYSKESL